jgi:hypothetical protein
MECIEAMAQIHTKSEKGFNKNSPSHIPLETIMCRASDLPAKPIGKWNYLGF